MVYLLIQSKFASNLSPSCVSMLFIDTFIPVYVLLSVSICVFRCCMRVYKRRASACAVHICVYVVYASVECEYVCVVLMCLMCKWAYVMCVYVCVLSMYVYWVYVYVYMLCLYVHICVCVCAYDLQSKFL